MNNFRLGSIDWDSVPLLHGEHLSQETAYLEDLVRWVLHYGCPHGVVRMDERTSEDKSLSVVAFSEKVYRVTLRRCQVITPQGYWVDIGDEQPLTCDVDKEKMYGRVVSLYVGVDTVEKKRQEVKPSRSGALLECQLRWHNYALDYERTRDNVDWLQVAQIKTDERDGRLVDDPDFIPECVYLNSHPRLVSMVKSIRDKALEGLRVLEQFTPDAVPSNVGMTAGQFAAALASAAVAVDWQSRPRAYVEQLTAVLTANRVLTNVLCPVNTGYRDDALSAIESALNYVHSNAERELPLGETLRRIRQALEVLVLMYGQLSAAPRPEPQPRVPERTPYAVTPIKRK